MKDSMDKAVHPGGDWKIPPFEASNGCWYAQTPGGAVVLLEDDGCLYPVHASSEFRLIERWTVPFRYYFYTPGRHAFIECSEEGAKEYFKDGKTRIYRAEAGSTNLKQVFIDFNGKWCVV